MFPRFLSSIVSCRSVTILTFVAGLSQVVNMILTWQLRLKNQAGFSVVGRAASEIASENHRFSSITDNKFGLIHNGYISLRRRDFHLGYKLSDAYNAVLSRIAHWSVLDGSGEFRVSMGVLRGSRMGGQTEGPAWGAGGDLEEGDSPLTLTLITQCSFSHLHYLSELAKVWQGPISIAVFALSSEVQAVVQAFHLLRQCHREVQENVTFSLVFPLNSPSSPHIIPTADTTPCEKVFDRINQPNYEFSSVQYPNNLLRNIARKAVLTKFIFVIDVDMVPSWGLYESFIAFEKEKNRLEVNSSDDKMAWIVPAYEVKAPRIPTCKEELLALKIKGDARPFYQELCFKCQRYTDYPSWEKANVSNSFTLKILYEVLWQDPWEPFYLARADSPLYDERFRQYGFNRISQVCELHVAGFRFLVLDSVFVVHKGFKVAHGFHLTKDQEQEKNRILFRQFKSELKERYPESARRCY